MLKHIIGIILATTVIPTIGGLIYTAYGYKFSEGFRQLFIDELITFGFIVWIGLVVYLLS